LGDLLSFAGTEEIAATVMKSLKIHRQFQDNPTVKRAAIYDRTFSLIAHRPRS